MDPNDRRDCSGGVSHLALTAWVGAVEGAAEVEEVEVADC